MATGLVIASIFIISFMLMMFASLGGPVRKIFGNITSFISLLTILILIYLYPTFNISNIFYLNSSNHTEVFSFLSFIVMYYFITLVNEKITILKSGLIQSLSLVVFGLLTSNNFLLNFILVNFGLLVSYLYASHNSTAKKIESYKGLAILLVINTLWITSLLFFYFGTGDLNYVSYEVTHYTSFVISITLLLLVLLLVLGIAPFTFWSEKLFISSPYQYLTTFGIVQLVFTYKMIMIIFKSLAEFPPAYIGLLNFFLQAVLLIPILWGVFSVINLKDGNKILFHLFQIQLISFIGFLFEVEYELNKNYILVCFLSFLVSVYVISSLRNKISFKNILKDLNVLTFTLATFIFMGAPFTGVFTGKTYLIYQVFQQGFLAIACILILSIFVPYFKFSDYLRISVNSSHKLGYSEATFSKFLKFLIVCCVIILGIYPNLI